MQEIVDFILELDQLKGVTRKNKPLGLTRYENSAEHSWQIAMLAMALQAYAPVPVKIDHVVAMLLVHDIGEIDTGDTIVYAEGGWDVRKAAELVAVKRIFGLLPAPTGAYFLSLWQEFEAGATAEARFAGAIDRAMPALLNLNNQGQSWRENGISYERVVSRLAEQIETGCPALWHYLKHRLDQARDEGWFASAQ
ncbi:putative hydrolase of HD superfamily [Chitinivorax tropicus]|uniref:Putative hydrolase of HD superfamily n=1 Tax=Chitinivorax tropicus TaxID=714531 RepID=A0A840MQG9_9PROT|nr:HD domain-containing protein [Chitinivorax tropicus]MBB5019327.1 putative hydrolase of HD superfamily [Chitinivorax tropicus]